jgi:hypothetical protein
MILKDFVALRTARGYQFQGMNFFESTPSGLRERLPT